MTLRELVREFVAAKRRAERQRDRDVTVAWQTAALTRGTKGLPRLETLLGHSSSRRSAPQTQTPSEQRDVLTSIFGNRKPKPQTGEPLRLHPVRRG